MYRTSLFLSILAYLSLATSTPLNLTPSLAPRDVNPEAKYHCCNSTGPWPWTWGAGVKADLMNVLGDRFESYGKPSAEPYVLPAGPGRCKNFYTTPVEARGKWGGVGSEWWVCNDANTELKIPKPDEIDIIAAFQTLLVECKVDEEEHVCGQAFSQTPGYPYNLVINGTAAFSRPPGKV
ncbi:hypothetical protein HYFRA_00009573 [Hymenoscyphus fraxineus]|uniref:Uncharacterized protein n=1 Tax=Hymenoscyphus fraxineus TaxID=746836 RepID=A0A9N9KXD1_9HELO|nr:hypothetical protein HYFRA_00009573 [Hymenoscyphus fraxineus]